MSRLDLRDKTNIPKKEKKIYRQRPPNGMLHTLIGTLYQNWSAWSNMDRATAVGTPTVADPRTVSLSPFSDTEYAWMVHGDDTIGLGVCSGV